MGEALGVAGFAAVVLVAADISEYIMDALKKKKVRRQRSAKLRRSVEEMSESDKKRERITIGSVYEEMRIASERREQRKQRQNCKITGALSGEAIKLPEWKRRTLISGIYAEALKEVCNG